MEAGEFREAWRLVPEWSAYEVSNLGRVRRRTSGRVLRPCPITNASGKVYWRVCLYRRGAGGSLARRDLLLHRVVAAAWLPAPEDGQNVVHHRDTDPSNNRADNLEWATQSANVGYSWEQTRHGEAYWSEDPAPF